MRASCLVFTAAVACASASVSPGLVKRQSGGSGDDKVGQCAAQCGANAASGNEDAAGHCVAQCLGLSKDKEDEIKKAGVCYNQCVQTLNPQDNDDKCIDKCIKGIGLNRGAFSSAAPAASGSASGAAAAAPMSVSSTIGVSVSATDAKSITTQAPSASASGASASASVSAAHSSSKSAAAATCGVFAPGAILGGLFALAL